MNAEFTQNCVKLGEGIANVIQSQQMKSSLCWKSNIKHQNSIGGLPPDNVSEEDIAITVTESFKSSKQCNIAAAKANLFLGIFKKTFLMQGRYRVIKVA